MKKAFSIGAIVLLFAVSGCTHVVMPQRPVMQSRSANAHFFVRGTGATYYRLAQNLRTMPATSAAQTDLYVTNLREQIRTEETATGVEVLQGVISVVPFLIPVRSSISYYPSAEYDVVTADGVLVYHGKTEAGHIRARFGGWTFTRFAYRNGADRLGREYADQLAADLVFEDLVDHLSAIEAGLEKTVAAAAP